MCNNIIIKINILFVVNEQHFGDSAIRRKWSIQRKHAPFQLGDHKQSHVLTPEITPGQQWWEVRALSIEPA